MVWWARSGAATPPPTASAGEWGGGCPAQTVRRDRARELNHRREAERPPPPTGGLYGRSAGALDDSLKLFEEGTKLTAYCSKALKTAEQKIVKLTAAEEPQRAEEPALTAQADSRDLAAE